MFLYFSSVQLLRIFKHLPKPSLANLGRTSHRFLGLMQDDTLWKRLCVMGKILSPEHILIILSRKPVYLRMARTFVSAIITNQFSKQICCFLSEDILFCILIFFYRLLTRLNYQVIQRFLLFHLNYHIWIFHQLQLRHQRLL